MRFHPEPVNERPWADDQSGKPQLGLPPTPRQLEVFLLVIRLGGHRQAADSVGISLQSEKRHMTSLYARLGVYNQLGALWVLWPVLSAMAGERRGGERRRGIERRRRGAPDEAFIWREPLTAAGTTD